MGLADFVMLQSKRVNTEKSWTVKIADVDKSAFDLSAKNPNTPEEDPLRSPEEILDEIEKLDAEAAKVLAGIREML